MTRFASEKLITYGFPAPQNIARLRYFVLKDSRNSSPFFLEDNLMREVSLPAEPRRRLIIFRHALILSAVFILGLPDAIRSSNAP